MKKRKVKAKLNDKKTIKINIAMSILFIGVLSFISLGYALYGQSLNITGSSTFGQQGDIAITNVTLTSSKNVRSDSIPEFTDDAVDFNLTFEKAPGSTETDYQAVYSITIDNDTFYDYDFNLATFQPTITNSSNVVIDPACLTYELDGIDLGGSIPAGESVTFTLTLNFDPPGDDTYTVDGNMGTELEEQPHGSVIGAIGENISLDLRESENHNIAAVTVSVINSYQSPRTFTFGITDTSHFELVDSSGNPLSSYTINGGEVNDYTIYVQRVANAAFSQEYFTTNITLSYNEVTNSNCGSLTIHVDEQEIVDTTPPVISNLSVTINDATSETTSDNNVGSLTLNWTGTEPESAVKKYYVLVYKGNNATPTKYETTDNNPQYTLTGLDDANYYFKVYGENTQDKKPTDNQISSCNDSYCAKTSSTQYKWHLTISLTNDTNNINSISPTVVNRGKSTSVTIVPSTYTTQSTCGGSTTNYYVISSNATVKMDGVTMSTGTGAGQYQFSVATTGNKAGTLKLYGITGDVTVKLTTSQS